MVGDDGHGGVPADRPVVVVASGSVDGFREPTLLAEPVVGSLGEVADRVGGKEARSDPAVGGFLGDCLGPVLTELEPRRAVRFGPRAARAVESVRLVDAQHRAGRFAGAELVVKRTQRRHDPREPGCPSLRRTDGHGTLGDLVTRCGLGH